MKKFLWDNRDKVVVTLICFLVFFIVYRIVPMTYDGWASKYAYSSVGGLLKYIYYIIFDSYVHSNGRIISNLICGIIESFPSEIPLDFFNALMIVLIFIFYFLLYGNKYEKKFNFGILLFTSMIFLMSYQIRTEVLFYANSAYIAPIPFVFLYLLLWKRYYYTNKSSKLILYLSIIGFCISTWMEHIAFGFLCLSSFLSIYLIYKYLKNSDKLKYKHMLKLLIPNFFSLIGFIVMMLSPGLRANRTIVSSEPLINIISYNIKVLFVDIVSRNIYIFLIFSIFLFILLINKKSHNKFLTIQKLITMILLLIFLIGSIYNLFGFECLNFIVNLFPNLYLQSNFGWILVSIFMVIVLLLIAFYNVRKKDIFLYTTFLGFFSLVPMLITPNMGSRISSIGIFTFILLTISLLFDSKNDNFQKFFIILIIILSLDQIILITRRIYDVTYQRNKILYNAKDSQDNNSFDYDCYIMIPNYDYHDMFRTGLISQETIHYKVFLEAYKLDYRTNVLFFEHNIKAMKSVCKKDNKIFIKNDLNNYEKIKFNIYHGTDYSNIVEVKNTDWIKKDLDFEVKKGYYLFDVEFYDESRNFDLKDHFEIYIY